jgi:hypothetical protein
MRVLLYGDRISEDCSLIPSAEAEESEAARPADDGEMTFL